MDINGNASGPAAKSVTLTAGQSDYLDYPARLALTRLGQRIELQASPDIVGSPLGGGTDCMFFAEIFDQPTTGFSHVEKQPGPTGMPGQTLTFPLVGVAFGEVLRFNAVVKSPGPPGAPGTAPPPTGACVVTFDFVDGNGNHVIKDPGPQGFTLNPGQGAFLDFAAASVVSQVGQRVLAQPMLTIASADPTNPCAGVQSSAETFVSLTGYTLVAAGPGQ
jgi:hypothetical protein